MDLTANGRFLRRILPRSVLTCLLVGALFLLGRVAATMPYWYDELLTVRLASLPSLADTWRALTSGFDFNPPLNYVLTRLARAMFDGGDPLSARLPALAGLALLTTGLFAVLERRVGSWFALAVVAPVLLTNVAIQYATDARPYMMLAGVSAWALYCRQSRDGRNGQSSALNAGLAATTATAMLLHVWGVLLLLALIAGEIAFAVRHRVVRVGSLIALAATAPLVVVYQPLVAAARGLIFNNEVYAPTLSKLAAVFLDSQPPVRFIAAILLAGALVGFWRRRSGTPQTIRGGGLTVDEWVVAGALVLSPLVPYAYALITGGVFMPRYGCLALPGAVMLAGPLLRWIARGYETAGAAAAAVAVISVASYLPARLDLTLPSQPTSVLSLDATASLLDPAVPILLVNPTDVLPFDEVAGDTWQGRVFYPADSDLALTYTGTNAIDEGYVRGAPYLGLRIPHLTTADLERVPRVYLVGRWQALSWVPKHLESRGWVIAHVGGLPTCPVHVATRPAIATPRAQ